MMTMYGRCKGMVLGPTLGDGEEREGACVCCVWRGRSTNSPAAQRGSDPFCAPLPPAGQPGSLLLFASKCKQRTVLITDQFVVPFIGRVMQCFIEMASVMDTTRVRTCLNCTPNGGVQAHPPPMGSVRGRTCSAADEISCYPDLRV